MKFQNYIISTIMILMMAILSSNVSSVQAAGQSGTPLGIVDEDDFAAVYGTDMEEQSDYPGALTEAMYSKSLDEKGELGDGIAMVFIIVLLAILFATNKMMMHPKVSLQGSSTIVVSFMFFGALKGYFAHIALVGAGLGVVMLICLGFGAVQCYRQGVGLYRIGSIVVSLALGFVAYHTALMLFYGLGWFIGIILLAAILILFLVFVLRLEFRGVSTQGRSAVGGGSGSSSGGGSSCSGSRLCRHYDGYGNCREHFDGIHNVRCDGHDYGHNCRDFKEA